jgi:hypothetical protein
MEQVDTEVGCRTHPLLVQATYSLEDKICMSTNVK